MSHFPCNNLLIIIYPSSPHESIKNHSGENSSTEEDELFYPSDEDLDSEGEERTKKKPSKFKDDLKLKKKFNALLRKMKLNDTDEPMIDDEVTQPDQYSATFSSIMRDDSDDSVHSDSDSVGTLPKPHLRPYFTADFDRDSDKESSTDEGTSSKKADHEPPSTATRKTSEENRRGSSMLGSPVSGAQRPSTRTSSAGPAPVIGDLRQDAVDEESNSVASPLRQSPTSQGSADDTRMGSFDDMSEGHNIIDQLDVIFNKGDTASLAVPETIVLAYCKDKNCYHPIMKAMLASNACVFLHTGSDAKVFISTLVNKMQKCATRHSRLSPVKLAVIGDLSSTNVILKPLMDSLNNKSPEWIQNFQFIFIPTDPNNPISRYVSSVDESYTRLLDSLSVECETDVLAAYQRDAKDIVNLSIGRVLVTQLVNETDEDTKQFEVPFLNSVSIVFNRKSCVNCAEEDDPEKCSIHEIDIQVDYTSLHKKDANSKQMQVKGIFRELGVTRELGDQSITLKAAYRERKPKVALSRLKKQQQPDINSINCHVNSFTCMIRPHTCLTCTVRVDGEEYKNVLSLYVFPLWSPNHNFIPLLVSSPATAGVLC
ncbi:phosphofurin acidic cluster sorting protein 2-like isoform X2 [Bolinopsis microptera]|uniref:phosphofurin acidic cluster sorting protein 2-like isoform X2 n=1 Tax=Bolinopsis microptera TaxID=2820187 RepID=UPI003078D377